MKLFGLLSLFLWLRCENVIAAFPTWRVQPSVCVTQKLEDACTFTLTVHTENLSDEQHCLYIQDKKLHCFISRAAIFKVAITLTEQSILELKDLNENVILSHRLTVKSVAKQKHRQRIRSPWSLF